MCGIKFTANFFYSFFECHFILCDEVLKNQKDFLKQRMEALVYQFMKHALSEPEDSDWNICNLLRDHKLSEFRFLSKSTSKSYSVLVDSRAESRGTKIGVVLKFSPENRHAQILGLLYETAVYKYISKNIIMPGICDNFIPYLGSGSCTLEQVSEFLSVLQKHNPKVAQYFSYVSTVSRRLNILATENVTFQKRSFPAYNFFKQPEGITDYDIYSVFFQIVYALKILGDFKVVHNDLHLYNIFVVEENSPQTIQYEIPDEKGAKIFYITRKYRPYIFDWDLAYAEPLGDNASINDPHLCAEYGVCNRFSSKSDLFNISRNISDAISSKNPESQLVFFIRAFYDSPLFEIDTYMSPIELSIESIENIKIFLKPFYENDEKKIYRTTKPKLTKIAPLNIPTLDVILGSEWFLLAFEIANESSIQLVTATKGFNRMTNTDIRFPTPMDLLTKSMIFSVFEVYPLESPTLFFKAPEHVMPISIFIDPSHRDRTKIPDMPALPFQHSGYVKTKPHELERLPPFSKTPLFRPDVPKMFERGSYRLSSEFHKYYEISALSPESIEKLRSYAFRSDIYGRLWSNIETIQEVAFNAMAVYDVFLLKQRGRYVPASSYEEDFLTVLTLSEHVIMGKEPYEIKNRDLWNYLIDRRYPIYGTAYYFASIRQAKKTLSKALTAALLVCTLNGKIYETKASVSALNFLENPLEYVGTSRPLEDETYKFLYERAVQLLEDDYAEKQALKIQKELDEAAYYNAIEKLETISESQRRVGLREASREFQRELEGTIIEEEMPQAIFTPVILPKRLFTESGENEEKEYKPKKPKILRKKLSFE